jgi:HlyD family secretion protein
MKIVIIILSIIAVVVGGYFAFQGIFGGQESPYKIVPLARGEVRQIVSVTGTVISAKQIDLQFESSGEIKSIAVEVGNRVEANQVLIRLDAGELNAQLLASQAALERAEAKLAQTLEGTKPEDIQVYQSDVDKAEVEVTNKEQALADAQADADNDLEEAYEDALDATKTVYTTADQALLITFAGVREEYFTGSGQLALSVKSKENKAKDDLSVAEDYLDTAQVDSSQDNIDSALNKMETALNSIRSALTSLRSAMDDPSVSGSVSTTDETNIDAERSNIDAEIVNLTSADQTISSTKIANQTNINTAQANLDEAKAALKKAQDELASQKAGPRQVDIDLAEAEVREARAGVLQIQQKINKTILRAPTAGTITAIKKEEGERAEANTIILSMISAGNFQIEANVSETEIAKVNLEDEVAITLDALGPDELFTGQIIKVDPAETVVSGVIYYKVTSIFDAEDKRIKPGMTANLDIQTEVKENVLYLPYYVIKEKDSQKYVLVSENGEVKERLVKTGLEGETNVEIIEGLREEEKVVAEQ